VIDLKDKVVMIAGANGELEVTSRKCLSNAEQRTALSFHTIRLGSRRCARRRHPPETKCHVAQVDMTSIDATVRWAGISPGHVREDRCGRQLLRSNGPFMLFADQDPSGLAKNA